MKRMLFILRVGVLAGGCFSASALWAEATTLGILVEIRSTKLQHKVYPGLGEGELGRAIAGEIKTRLIGNKAKEIAPRPPLNQWNIVVVPNHASAPPNRLVFTIEENNEAMRLRLSFVSENGSIEPSLMAEWRRPGDSTPYPAQAVAAAMLADLFIAAFIDGQFPTVIERLSFIPLAHSRWQPSDGMQIALPLPAARHAQLRGSFFRIFGHWERHEHRTEIGDVEVFADGAQNYLKSRWFDYEALAVTWNESNGNVAYDKFSRCTRRLHFQTVFLAKYRIPSSARALSR
jgi:hypothetical protein